jgi:RNA polymerase sigma-70 factor, ECF subfamily
MVREGPSEDDARLMASFVETRDRRMFERLFQTHRTAMVAFAGRFVRDRARAEELAQEIFVRVYTTKNYQADASFKTWLYRVATNVCLNELRRPEHKQAIESLDADPESPRQLAAPAEALPESLVAGRELAKKLQTVLATLPEKQRAAFVMARFEALSHEEIAGALDTSVSAVKSLVHRALETMRRETAALLKDGPDEVRPAEAGR